MAKRKGFARRTRRSFARFARRARSGGSSENLMMTAGAAFVYGAVRPKVEQLIQPVSSKIPVGGAYTDELLLGGIGYALARGKMPIVKGKLARSVGKAVLMIEAARAGSGLGANFVK